MLLAIRNYVMHQSANQAGSLAFSWVLAMFPLLILLSASAGFVGRPGDAAALAGRVIGYAPQLVRDAMQPVINQVLAHRSQALLAIGVLATLWTASSGMQAIRSALNRAYGIERGLPFWQARIKVTLFTVIVGAGVLAAGARALRRAPGPFAGVLPTALGSLDSSTLARLDRDLGKLIAALGADERGAHIPLG